MPREEEMKAKDKYSMFDRKEKRYRKVIRSKFLPGSCGCGEVGCGVGEMDEWR